MSNDRGEELDEPGGTFMTERIKFGVIAAVIAVCVGSFLMEWGVHAVRMHTMPHHWYAVEYGSRGSRARGSDYYLLSAIGPFASREACLHYNRDRDIAEYCINMVDEEVQPTQGLRAP